MNLLGLALSIIPPVTVGWVPAVGRELNAIGQWVTTYADDPTTLSGSFQPLEKAKYEALGLDMNKHYFVFYVSAEVKGVERDRSGDILIHNQTRYQVEDVVDWYFYDGWLGLVCVDIGPN